ncbi:MAG: hypothetical protein IPI03_20725 [Rubrivivax sp.]|nr:hypothetical protein [Rubrivivax sp.]
MNPKAALKQHSRGNFQMEFATLDAVRALERFGGSAALLQDADQSSLPPVHPRLKLGPDGHVAGVLLPGQAGYDEARGEPV